MVVVLFWGPFFGAGFFLYYILRHYGVDAMSRWGWIGVDMGMALGLISAAINKNICVDLYPTKKDFDLEIDAISWRKMSVREVVFIASYIILLISIGIMFGSALGEYVIRKLFGL